MTRGWLLAVALVLGCAGKPAPDPEPADAAAGHTLDWAPWAPESFARAAAEDRLILVNVIATWCHWCHVMDEVTYEDPEVQALLAEHFVVIRVDSDARPDILERYRAWGWPAIALLSPAAEPVMNIRGFRKPEVFAALLRELIEEHARGELRRFDPDAGRGAPADADLDAARALAVAQLDAYFDPEGLGWGGNQKYPWPEPIEYALLRARTRDELDWQDRALATLEAERALIDPVWGGMYQYSLGGVWDRPHFEKIAMIQGGAVENYAHAAMITGDPRWLEPARQISAYLLERMQDPKGGFFTSQDADLSLADGTRVEGKRYYALDEAGREALGVPRVDEAVYADLNGLMIHGLVQLYRATGDAELLRAATRAADRILVDHRHPAGGLGHGPLPATDELRHLADQAAMAWALLALHEATADPRWRNEAVALAEFMVDALASPSGALYAHTPDPAAVGVFAQRREPQPENALAAQLFIELHMVLDGDGSVATPWLERARGILLAFASEGRLESEGKRVGRYLFALELLGQTKFDLSVVAAPGDPAGDALFTAALEIWEPRAKLERSVPGERYPDLGHAALYLCSDVACSKPLRDPETLAADALRFLTDG